MKSAIFMLNKECNQECRFCLNSFEDKEELNLDEKKKVLDRLKDAGVEVVAFSGGEPLLCKHLVEIVNYAYYKHNFRIIIQTNGTLLKKELLKKLKGKLLALEVSLEGTKKEHNFLVNRLNFRKVVRNIKLAKDVGLEVFTNFTITKVNLKCLKEYVGLLEKLDVKIANFTRLYLAGRALENFKSLLPTEKEEESFLKEISSIKSDVVLNVQAGFKEDMLKSAGIKNYSTCSIGKEITITPDGGVRLCPSWHESWGDALTSNLDFLDDIKPEDGCLVNSLKEAKAL